MAAPTIADLVQQGRATMLIRRPDLDALPGDITDFLLNAGAAGADRVILFAAVSVANSFLDTASGDALTVLVEDRNGPLFTRQPATAAIGAVSFTAPGGPTSGTILAGSRVATVADGITGEFVTYTTDVGLTFTAEAGPKSVTVTASTTGAGTNVKPLAIQRVLDNLFDTFTVTNLERTAGGNEEEPDEDLRQRARDFAATQRRGTTEALVVGALQVKQVRKASVFVGSTGLVTVYVADADGNSNLEMIQLVETELLMWACAGVPPTVSGSLPVLQNITVALTVKTGISTTALADDVVAAITGQVNRLQSGETLFRDSIKAAAIAVDRDNILAVDVTLPLADIVPAANEIIRAGVVSVG